jgi:hypothetical protein
MSICQVRVRPPEQRIREIALRSREAAEKHLMRQEFKFRNGREMLPLVTLPADYPIYRLENYRTGDDQLNLVAEGKVAEGFFHPSRREDPSVQQWQHALLVEQSKRGSGETIKPIYDELARAAEQTEHLIITHDGVVVNGNRRLAAMRELIAEPGGAYAGFANIVCLVLPESATPREVRTLEIGLQMQPETRLPYEWTALGRAVRDLRRDSMQDDEIAREMNRDIVEIRRAAIMIDAADLYLTEWIGKPNAYRLLEDTEQAFKQVATRNWGQSAEAGLREKTRQFDFFLIENRKDIMSERAYSLINTIEQSPRKFLEQVALEWDIDLPKASPTNDLAISFEDPTEEVLDHTPLINELLRARKDPELSKRRVEELVQICAIVGDQSKNREKAALKFARDAEKALRSIDLRTADPGTYSDIATRLLECSALAERLQQELSTQRKRRD